MMYLLYYHPNYIIHHQRIILLLPTLIPTSNSYFCIWMWLNYMGCSRSHLFLMLYMLQNHQLIHINKLNYHNVNRYLLKLYILISCCFVSFIRIVILTSLNMFVIKNNYLHYYVVSLICRMMLLTSVSSKVSLKSV